MQKSPESNYGVIFDMDGVLVDSSAAHLRAWRQLGEENGMPFSEDVFDRTFGMHNRQIIPIWLESQGGGATASLQEIDALSARKESVYRDVAVDTLQPLPGIPKLIHDLGDDGFRLAVGSSGPKENVELVLRILDVSERFAALSTGDEVLHGKPHPEVFLKAAEKLALPPERCVVIEDAPQGVEAARNAGARVVAVTSTRSAADLEDADLIVESLAELTPERLRGLIDGERGPGRPS